MLRRSKIPERTQKDWDQQLFEEELNWLKMAKEGKLLESHTSPDIFSIVIGSLLFTFIVGVTTGTMIGVFTRSFLPLVLIPIIVFLTTFYFTLKPYAIVQLHPNERLFLYEGNMEFAGDEKSTRYRGPIEVINGLQLVEYKKREKYFLRLLTSSGYMRLNYDPQGEKEFLQRLQSLELLNLNDIVNAISDKQIIRHGKPWSVLYELKFDRTEFKEKLKKERIEREERLRKEREAKKEELVRKSKERLKKR